MGEFRNNMDRYEANLQKEKPQRVPKARRQGKQEPIVEDFGDDRRVDFGDIEEKDHLPIDGGVRF